MFHDVSLSRPSLKFYSPYPETIPVTTVNINESPRIDGRKPWKALVRGLGVEALFQPPARDAVTPRERERFWFLLSPKGGRSVP